MCLDIQETYEDEYYNFDFDEDTTNEYDFIIRDAPPSGSFRGTFFIGSITPYGYLHRDGVVRGSAGTGPHILDNFTGYFVTRAEAERVLAQYLKESK